MQTTFTSLLVSSRAARALRIAAATVLLAVLSLWAGTGAHLGWTQTSRVTVQHDEITGIDYPVREPAFVAGVELLAAGLGLAAAVATAGWWAGRRAGRRG
ncbi:MAG: hypothetical protein MUE42_15415 [Opitutaceae bacterium]|nr:hypothetical protein [Opitutaceae bacterium]